MSPKTGWPFIFLFKHDFLFSFICHQGFPAKPRTFRSTTTLPNAAETHHLPGDTGTQLSERKPILYKALGTESGDACELGVGAAPGTTGDTEDAAFSASPSLRSQQCHRFVCYTNNS